MTAPAARPLRGAALVLVAATLWGSFGIFARALYAHGYSAPELTSVRIWIGFLALLVAAPFMPGGVRGLRLAPRDHLFFLAYGSAGFAAFAYLFFATVERTTVAVAAALLYTAPAFVVLLARMFLGERIDGRRALALAAVLAGVLLVTGAATYVRTGTDAVPAAAIALGIGSGLSYALYTLFGKHASRRFGAFPILFHTFAVAALIMLVVAPPWPPLLRAPASLPLALALGLGPSLLAFGVYLRALRELAAGTAAMLASLEPVIAALLATLLLAEPIDAGRLAGVALIAGAAILLVGGPTRSRA